MRGARQVARRDSGSVQRPGGPGGGRRLLGRLRIAVAAVRALGHLQGTFPVRPLCRPSAKHLIPFTWRCGLRSSPAELPLLSNSTAPHTCICAVRHRFCIRPNKAYTSRNCSVFQVMELSLAHS